MNELPVVSNGKEEYEKKEDDYEKVKTILSLAKVDLDLSSHASSYLNITKLDLFQANLDEHTFPSFLPEFLPNLEILFCMKNNFTQVPATLSSFKNLSMVSFKSNKLTSIHPDALDKQLKWLILTDNKLSSLPSTIGRCTKLQKLMLSGNQITDLPLEIKNCQNLELVRLASNKLNDPPIGLLKLPKLSWVAFSDNPFLENHKKNSSSNDDDENEDDKELKLYENKYLDDPDHGEVLGRGASGITRKYIINTEPVAVKTFYSNITSDGNPQEERKVALVASCIQSKALIEVLGRTQQGNLVMELLTNYKVLANPPNMQTCSRDVYDDDMVLSLKQTLNLVNDLLFALMKLHMNGINHGDFYGHNILMSTVDESQSWLTDFGAAFFYDRESEYGDLIELTERRAFSHLVREVSQVLIVKDDSVTTVDEGVVEQVQQILNDIAGSCESLSFTDLYTKWNALIDPLAKHFE